ncbi:hypothetical protein H7827_04930 [Streptomyces sp. JH002]|uniref:hypothetical protein n=1 Tax=Streptomyces TaxID=1883 RepID=UPI0036B2E5BF
MNGEDSLQYLPEQFRESARHHHDAADSAGVVSRRLGNVGATASQFGGDGAAGFSTALTAAAADRSHLSQRAGDGRDAIGEGALGAADMGDETEALADSYLFTAANTDYSRGIADSI